MLTMPKPPTHGKDPKPSHSTENLPPEQGARKAVAAVYGALGNIVQAMIDRAQAGSHLHAKLLLDFAGVSAAALPPEAGTEGPALAQMLIEKLDRMAEESAAAQDERPVE